MFKSCTAEPLYHVVRGIRGVQTSTSPRAIGLLHYGISVVVHAQGSDSADGELYVIFLRMTVSIPNYGADASVLPAQYVARRLRRRFEEVSSP